MRKTAFALAISLAWLGCGDDGGPLGGADGGTTTMGGDGGGPLTGIDAGPSTGTDGGARPDTDAGTAPAAEAPIAISGSCSAEDACGGDPIGSWQYAGGCVADPFGALYEECPTATVSDEVATVRGIVTISALDIVRDATVHVSATAHIPPACSLGMCSLIESALASGFERVSCSAAGGGCDCDIEATERIVDGDTYSVAGSTLTTGDGDRYSFCVDGSTLRYRPLDTGEDGTYELSRR